MKAPILSAAFAAFVVAANWHSTTIYERTHGTTRTSFDGAGLVVICCLVALLFFSHSIYRSFRLCLERGIRIPLSVQLIRFWPCLLLTPLLLRYSVSITAPNSAGVIVTHDWGFGSDFSVYALVLAAITIAAFQLRLGLERSIQSTGNV
jgi:hypothetical protein